VPVIAMVGRLNSQKGLDLVDYVIADIMREDLQLVCLGLGESRYVNLFSWAEQNYPGRVAAQFVMDNDLSHRVYAGADIFLMPSAFEPCGLSQMIALRYGAVPVVRETGGLRDTVLSYNEFTGEGNGFSFFNYNAHDMLHVIQRALRYFWDDKATWQKLQHRGMAGDYSWRRSSQRYLEIYQKLLPVLLPVKSAAQETAPQPARPEAPAEAVAEKPLKPAKKAPPKTKKEAADPVEKPAKTPPIAKAPAKPKAATKAKAAPGKAAAETPAPKPRKPKA